MVGMTSEEYNQLLDAIKAAPPESEPSCVIARSVEDAYAFAQWCVDNGLEEPEVRIVQRKRL